MKPRPLESWMTQGGGDWKILRRRLLIDPISIICQSRNGCTSRANRSDEAPPPDRVGSARAKCLQSPDSHAIFRLEIKLVARFHAPGVIPSIDIAHGPVDAEARGRMRIGRYLPLECIGAGLVAPNLCPAEEYALLACEAVENRS